MKKHDFWAAVLTLAIAGGVTSGATAATMLNVDWGGTPQSLGTITGDGSGADFYDYGGGTTNSGLTLDLATAYAFVHESNTTGALSFGMIFTGSNIATPRTTCAAAPAGDPSLFRTTFEGTLSGAGPSSSVSVKDDLANIFGDSDATAPGANGFYQLIPFTGTTDGFVVDGIMPGSTLSLDVSVFDNFENLVFVDGTEDAPVYTPFTLTGGDADLSIQIGTSGPNPAVIPLPAGMALMLGALGLLGGIRATFLRKI